MAFGVVESEGKESALVVLCVEGALDVFRQQWPARQHQTAMS